MAENISPALFLKESADGIVIDVRTPLEFAAGHIPGAVNIPLFSNEERVVVGTLYKKEGRDAAVLRGLEFVGPKMAQMVAEARRLMKKRGKERVFLYCWRGGMRSGSVAWLFCTAGIETGVLEGGYKAYRHSFIEALENGRWNFMVLIGPTGCGKTALLQEMKERGEQVIDLEGIARHRGSAFGRCGYEEPQPSSEHFSNLVYDQLLRLDDNKTIWCEGESISIGHVFMLQQMYDRLSKSPMAFYKIPLEKRLERIIADYGEYSRQELTDSFNRIRKRLGFDRAEEALAFVESGDLRSAAAIAINYYDKGYAASTAKRSGETVAQIEMEDDNIAEAAGKLIETRKKYEKSC